MLERTNTIISHFHHHPLIYFRAANFSLACLEVCLTVCICLGESPEWRSFLSIVLAVGAAFHIVVTLFPKIDAQRHFYTAQRLLALLYTSQVIATFLVSFSAYTPYALLTVTPVLGFLTVAFAVTVLSLWHQHIVRFALRGAQTTTKHSVSRTPTKRQTLLYRILMAATGVVLVAFAESRFGYPVTGCFMSFTAMLGGFLIWALENNRFRESPRSQHTCVVWVVLFLASVIYCFVKSREGWSDAPLLYVGPTVAYFLLFSLGYSLKSICLQEPLFRRNEPKNFDGNVTMPETLQLDTERTGTGSADLVVYTSAAPVQLQTLADAGATAILSDIETSKAAHIAGSKSVTSCTSASTVAE